MRMLGLIKDYLLKFFCRYNPFTDAFQILDEMKDHLVALREDISSIRKDITTDVQELESEVMVYKYILHAVGEAIPDMLWFKDMEGKYLYANKAIKDGLLLDDDPIGKTDQELAEAARRTYGAENHTFGELCADSDQIVKQTKAPGRFLEHGKIKGKMMYLEVFKAPVYSSGELIGVCGSGRDMTAYVEAYRNDGCYRCDSMKDIFKMYEFTGKE